MGTILRVLVVDDDLATLAAYRRSLAAHRVVTASNATTACLLAATEGLDLAIVDLRLGDTSGLDLLHALKRQHPDLKIALVSAHATIDIAVVAAKAGADVVALKPVEPTVDEPMSLARVEYEHITRITSECGGNVSEAARRLKVHRHTLERRLKQGAPS